MRTIPRSRTALAAIVAAAWLLVLASQVSAHGQVSVTVTPSTVTAGDPVTLQVSGVEPDQQRVIVLVGQGIVVEFPTVRTDSTGSFTTKVEVPSRLPGGTYRFEAIGDETLTGDVNVIAAAGGIAAEVPPDLGVPATRTRSGVETGAIIAVAVLAMAAGALVVVRGEHILQRL